MLRDSDISLCGNLIKIPSMVKTSHLFEGKKITVLNSVKLNFEISTFFLNFKNSSESNSPDI